MTMITLEHQITEEERLLGDARAALQLLREEITAFREQLACAEGREDAPGTPPEIKRLNLLYASCVETENRLAQSRHRKAGIAQNGIAFNLDEARAAIRGKLDRLRAAQTEGGVS